MFLYITLGSNDLARARPFYDAVMANLGASLKIENATEFGYGPAGSEDPMIYIVQPYDEKPATVGNGSMPAFAVATRATVDAFYAAAMANGGQDEGKPGLRYSENFYSCYVRDPDGNKLSAVCIAVE